MLFGQTYFSLSLALWHSALVLGGLLLYVVVTRMRGQYRQPVSAFAWVMLIILMPYAGIPLFLLFGTRKVARLARQNLVYPPVCLNRLEPQWATALFRIMELPPLSYNQSVEFHEDGMVSLRQLRSLIESAEHSLDVSTFILSADAVGRQVVELLLRRHREGVKVRVMIDAVGALWGFNRLGHRLSQAGVEVRYFMPLVGNPLHGRINLRNHRKMLIADGQCLWSGGRNLGAEYFLDRPRSPVWCDLSFSACGELAMHAAILFQRDWMSADGTQTNLPREFPESSQDQGILTRLIPSGPDWADDTFYNLLLASAYQAEDRILAVTPYFMPDEALLSAWMLACRRGVKLDLLVPQRSNHWLADVARERALRELARSGARIWLYPGMIHAKCFLVDSQLALVGSANLDGRSLFLNFEMMTAFYEAKEIAWLDTWINHRKDEAVAYEPSEPGWLRDVGEGLVRTVGYQL
jgi:cardiolipin synthase